MPLVQQKTYYPGWKAANEQIKGRNWSARTSSALQAFVLLFALFNKSRSKFSQVLNSVLRFGHCHSPGEDHLVKAPLTCLGTVYIWAEVFFPRSLKTISGCIKALTVLYQIRKQFLSVICLLATNKTVFV